MWREGACGEPIPSQSEDSAREPPSLMAPGPQRAASRSSEVGICPGWDGASSFSQGTALWWHGKAVAVLGLESRLPVSRLGLCLPPGSLSQLHVEEGYWEAHQGCHLGRVPVRPSIFPTQIYG